jgi:hypothetical protein
MEADLNTSTIALRVVGGDEKGTQCLGNHIPGVSYYRILTMVYNFQRH